jgi:acetyl esterase/lipase
MKKYENLQYGTSFLDLYLPDSPSFDLFVYFHGGGLEGGDKSGSATRINAPYLAENGIAVASCNYRMYPEASYPDFVKDAAEALRWLSDHIAQYGRCDRLFVGGSSAGAYLSMMLCFDKRWYAESGFSLPVAGYFHDAGQPTCHYNVLRERGIDPRRVMIDDSAPLYHVDSANYPPMCFVVSDNDMHGRLEQTVLTLATLRHFGYDERKLTYHLMHGKHCAYCKQTDEQGVPILGKMILGWIKSIE